MSNIDFEEDQTKMLGKTENIQSLADQVEKLNTLDQQVVLFVGRRHSTFQVSETCLLPSFHCLSRSLAHMA